MVMVLAVKMVMLVAILLAVEMVMLMKIVCLSVV